MKTKSSSINPWPWSILGFFIFLISAIGCFVAFAVGQDMQLVRPDYYERELRFQEDIDDMTNARGLGPRAGLAFDRERLILAWRMPAAHVAAGAEGAADFYRPSDADLDFTMPLEPDVDGRQAVNLEKLKPGLWRIRISWSVKGRGYLLRDSFVIPENPAAP